MASKIASSQLIAQAIGAVIGFLVIRVTEKREMAAFTIALSIQGVMNILSDLGNSAFISIGGRVWQDPYKLGQLSRTYMYVKRVSMLTLGILIMPYLAWLLITNHATLGYSIAIIVVISIELYFYILNSNFTFIYQIHSQIRKLQYSQIIAPFVRLIFILIFSLTAIKIVDNKAISLFSISGIHYQVQFIALYAISASLMGTIVQYFFLRKDTYLFIDTETVKNSDDQKQIIKLIKKLFLPSLFFCVQGQLTIFLISTFGTTEGIADMGALGRISILFVLMNSVTTNVANPGFARCHDLATMKKRYVQIILISILISLALVLVVWLFPNQILWMLGPKYSKLKNELFLLIIFTLINQLSGVVWGLNIVKSWVSEVWLAIPVIMFSQLVMILFFKFNFSSVKDVIYFNIFSVIPMLMANLYFSWKGFKNYKEEVSDESPAIAE